MRRGDHRLGRERGGVAAGGGPEGAHPRRGPEVRAPRFDPAVVGAAEPLTPKGRLGGDGQHLPPDARRGGRLDPAQLGDRFRTPAKILAGRTSSASLADGAHYPRFEEVERAIGVAKMNDFRPAPTTSSSRRGGGARLDGDYISRNAPGHRVRALPARLPIAQGQRRQELHPHRARQGRGATCARAVRTSSRAASPAGSRPSGGPADRSAQAALTSRRSRFSARERVGCRCSTRGWPTQRTRRQPHAVHCARGWRRASKRRSRLAGRDRRARRQNAVLAPRRRSRHSARGVLRLLNHLRHSLTGCMFGDASEGTVPLPVGAAQRDDLRAGHEDRRSSSRPHRDRPHLLCGRRGRGPPWGEGHLQLVPALEKVLTMALRGEARRLRPHPMGTCRMADQKEHGVVKPTGESWDVEASTFGRVVFPTSLGSTRRLRMSTSVQIARQAPSAAGFSRLLCFARVRRRLEH